MSESTSEPMSDARLAQIRALLDETESARERLTGLMGDATRPRAPILQAARDLFADNETLRARVAELTDMYQRLHATASRESERLRAELRAASALDAETTRTSTHYCPHTRVAWIGRDTRERNVYRCDACSTVLLYRELSRDDVIFDT